MAATFILTEERYRKVHNWFEKVGRWSLFLRILHAGVRHFTAMVAGASDLEYRASPCSLLRRLHLGVVFPFNRLLRGRQLASASEQVHHYLWKSVWRLALPAGAVPDPPLVLK